MKKNLRALILAALLAALAALPAAANGPVPSQEVEVTISNAPEGAAYCELLMPKENILEEYYTDLNELVFEYGEFPEDAEILSYSAEAEGKTLVSAALHDDTEAFAYLFKTPGDDSAMVCADSQARGSAGGWFEYVQADFPKCFAILSESGEVLAVSEVFGAMPRSNQYAVKLLFDAQSGAVTAGEPEPEEGGVGQILLAILLIPLICLLTVIIEVLVALPFKVRPKRVIALTTAVTNIAMNVGIVRAGAVIGRELPYTLLILIAEAAVVVIEYLIYRRVLKRTTGEEASRGRILAYTITANLASLILCSLLNFGLWYA